MSWCWYCTAWPISKVLMYLLWLHKLALETNSFKCSSKQQRWKIDHISFIIQNHVFIYRNAIANDYISELWMECKRQQQCPFQVERKYRDALIVNSLLQSELLYSFCFSCGTHNIDPHSFIKNPPSLCINSFGWLALACHGNMFDIYVYATTDWSQIQTTQDMLTIPHWKLSLHTLAQHIPTLHTWD